MVTQCQFCTMPTSDGGEFDTQICQLAYEGNPLRRLISERGLSVRGLADFAECAPSQVTRACLGDQLPTKSVLRRIGGVLGEGADNLVIALRNWRKHHANAIERRRVALERRELDQVRSRIRELRQIIEVSPQETTPRKIAQAAIGNAEAAMLSYDHEPSEARRTVWVGIAARLSEAAKLAWELV